MFLANLVFNLYSGIFLTTTFLLVNVYLMQKNPLKYQFLCFFTTLDLTKQIINFQKVIILSKYHVLTELWIFFYLEWCFLSQKCNLQWKQLWYNLMPRASCLSDIGRQGLSIIGCLTSIHNKFEMLSMSVAQICWYFNVIRN